MSAATNPRKDARILGVPFVAAIFFFAVMLPTDVSVSLGGLRISAYRLVLIVMFFPMLVKLLSGRVGRIYVFDMLVVGHCAWAFLSLIKWGGAAKAIETGGIYFLEFAGAYLVSRVYIRGYDDFVAFARLYVGTVVAVLIFTIPEALTSVHILHDSITSVLGGAKAPYIDKRMGLERAFASFDHPILYGIFSASAFSLAYFVIAETRLMNWRGMAKVMGVLLAVFLSASSGPFVVIMIQGVIAAYQRVMGKYPGRWSALSSIFVISYVVIDLFTTNTPFHFFVHNFTFSAQSSYNRILIFEYGTAEVKRHPIFGIGMGDWTRPSWMSDSMDNYWLLTTVRYGLPAFFMFVGLLLGLIWAVGQRKDLPEEWRRARHGWAFTLFGITVGAATVHLWNAVFVLFLFLIGTGVWLLDAKPGSTMRAQGSDDRSRAPAPRRQPARLF